MCNTFSTFEAFFDAKWIYVTYNKITLITEKSELTSWLKACFVVSKAFVKVAGHAKSATKVQIRFPDLNLSALKFWWIIWPHSVEMQIGSQSGKKET